MERYGASQRAVDAYIIGLKKGVLMGVVIAEKEFSKVKR